MLSAQPSEARSRIKDITDFEGIRANLLIGYGLVVGLNGSGDRLTNSIFTQQSLVSMLERLGVNTRGTTLTTQNVAAVMVTATMSAFSRHGTRIDVTVSTMGDATNLLGGTLLVTPLLGADGEVYAVAQGQLAVGGFTAQGASGTTITRGVPTSGRISSGAIIEREIEFKLAAMKNVNIALRNPDFTTAQRIAASINTRLGSNFAALVDPGTVALRVPNAYQGRVAELLTHIEQLMVEPDMPARVVIDETTGVIVMGENVRINTIAIAHGNLTIQVSETPQVSQPGAFSPAGAATTTVQRSEITVDDGSDNSLTLVQDGINLQDLVAGLNSLGVGPRDMMSILQAIKAAGALQAEIQVL
ncbi:MAG: flagellar basal body P-ring protein FlgI [Proteobacteria bacterium]|nr:flagellar basal body P-ring protein FlgI [Pseudomonadota bacterium]MDA1356128.1 flagellar basal body P-ring protein FlgI [Pseudomonadota bacterium]